jgi:hypothetical protein
LCLPSHFCDFVRICPRDLLTALWAAAGLLVLERLLRAAVLPPGKARNGFAIALWGAAKIAVYGVAVWVLFSRPLQH